MDLTKKPVLVSIDTEAPIGDNPIQNLIFGKVNNSEYGINMIMDILDKRKIKGLFFVDFAEIWDYGEEEIKNVVYSINKRGHDIGMHIHPDHMADKSRKFLWQYSYEEQLEIITKCTKMYEKMLDRKPDYFRAGRYGANNDTLDILLKCGYKIDFSEFYGNWRCKIEPAITCNKVVDYKGIIEVPVSSYKSFSCINYERFDKLDISMEFNEMKKIALKMREDDGVEVISLFVHSFSFLNWRRHIENPKYNKKEKIKFEKILDYLTDNGFEFIKARDIYQVNKEDFGRINVTDYSKIRLSSFYFLRRALKTIKMRMEKNV